MGFLRLSKNPKVEWVAWFGLAGVILPALLIFAHDFPINSPTIDGVSFYYYIFLFPFSMAYMGLSAEDSWLWSTFFALLFNSAYYSLSGYLIWTGLNKTRPVLYGFLTVFIAAWVFIFYSHS